VVGTYPDSAMYTLSAFRRRLHAHPGTRDVVMAAGRAHWLPAHTHAGENIGSPLTLVLFVELKDGPANEPAHRDGAIRAASDAPPPQHTVGTSASDAPPPQHTVGPSASDAPPPQHTVGPS
jgi:hypothetical protein